MTPQIFRRYHQAQDSMVLLTMPTRGIMECTLEDVLTSREAESLTGPLWRESQRLKLQQFRKVGN